MPSSRPSRPVPTVWVLGGILRSAGFTVTGTTWALSAGIRLRDGGPGVVFVSVDGAELRRRIPHLHALMGSHGYAVTDTSTDILFNVVVMTDGPSGRPDGPNQAANGRQPVARQGLPAPRRHPGLLLGGGVPAAAETGIPRPGRTSGRDAG